MEGFEWKLKVNNRALKYMDNIKAEELYEILKLAINSLKKEPQKSGHALKGKLKGYRVVDNITYIGVSYRIVYKYSKSEKVVTVMDIGTHEEYNTRLRTGF